MPFENIIEPIFELGKQYQDNNLYGNYNIEPSCSGCTSNLDINKDKGEINFKLSAESNVKLLDGLENQKI